MKKYIYSSVILLFLVLVTQSCYQDMERPGFNYPEELPEKPYSPMKLGLSFEDNINNGSIYNFGIHASGSPQFVEGTNGKAYKGATDTYLVIETPETLKDTIANLGSFTTAFWMKAVKCTKATGVFGIANTKEFWGNLDIYMESYSDNNKQAFFKIHLRNDDKEITQDVKIDDVFTNEWVHLVFKYDEVSSKLTVYRNGQEVFSNTLPNISGKLKFNNVGKAVLGTLQFQTIPSLTEGATAQGWSEHYLGNFDQFHFYNKALKKSEIRNLYLSKE